MIEYKREGKAQSLIPGSRINAGMAEFHAAMSGIAAHRVSMRGFRPTNYELRVVAYNK